MYRLITVLMGFMLLLQADHIADFASEQGYETAYAKAKAKAVREHKPLMLLLVTHYCPWCRKFEQMTLSDPKTAQRITQAFVPLILNREKKAFPAQFDTPRIPTTYFIDPKEERIIFKSMGYKSPREFSHVLDTVLKR